MDEKSASILAQVAAKVTAEISDNLEEYLLNINAVHNDLLNRVREGMTPEVPANVVPLQAPAQTPNFPPTVPTAQSVMNQATENVVAGMPGTQVTHSLDTIEERWADVFNNPDSWYNNLGDERSSINGGSSPDFKHKTLRDNQGRGIGVWLVNRRYGRTAPDWVFQKLQIAKPQLGPPQVARPGTGEPF